MFAPLKAIEANIIAQAQTESFLSSTEFEAAITHDDGQAAQQHLAAGRPIYYCDARCPENLIKKYPDCSS